MATPRQIALIEDLLDELILNLDDIEVESLWDLSFAEASEKIEYLLEEKRVRRETRWS